jgi:hypothetical protein
MLRLNPYPYVFALVALAGLYAGHRVIVANEVAEAVEIAETRLNNKHAQALLNAQEINRKIENKLEQHALTQERIKDNEINRITAERDDAIKRLRNRPERPSTPTPPKDSDVVQACTARELYREDAEFLTREAARAQSVIAERNYYYQQYEKVRKQLHGIDATD